MLHELAQSVRFGSDSTPMAGQLSKFILLKQCFIYTPVNIPSIKKYTFNFFLYSSFMHTSVQFLSLLLFCFVISPFDKSTREWGSKYSLQRCSIKIAIYLMKMRRWRCCCCGHTRKGFTVVAMCRCWGTH